MKQKWENYKYTFNTRQFFLTNGLYIVIVCVFVALCVLAGAVNLQTAAEVKLNDTNSSCVDSEGDPAVKIELDDLSVREEEKYTTAALVRGVAAAFQQCGCKLQGFNARVLPGSGLSLSAAFEVLMGTICNELFYDKRLSAVEVAQIGQWAGWCSSTLRILPILWWNG